MTNKELKEILHYDELTGISTWLENRSKMKVGDTAGSLRKDKSGKHYKQIKIRYKTYALHRIIWFYMTGRWPNQIDHIDGNGLNNKWNNLRDVNIFVNSQNQRTPVNNTSGVIGVNLIKSTGKWRSRISVKGERIDLGCFDDFNNAVLVRKQAEIKYNYHQNHGSMRSL